MNDVLFGLLTAVITVILVAITRYAIPYVKAKLEGSRLSWVTTWLEFFVNCAEQNIIGKNDKKTWVTEQLKKQLMKKNLDLTDEQISIMIDAMAKQLFPNHTPKEENNATKGE